MSEQKQLWSDERITAYIKGNRGAAQRGWTAWEVGDALKRVRDEYEAALAELEAKLIVVSRELISTDNADRYYRGFNQGYDHAEALMQQRIAELEAALAERGEWQPIGDGTIDMDGDTIDILIINDDTWHMTVTEADYSQAMLIMPPDIRLCRRRPQPAPASAVEATKG